MRISRFQKPNPHVVALLCVLLVGFAGWASGAPVTFSSRIHDTLRVADVEPVEFQGTLYVPIASVIGQLGGGCAIARNDIQLDLAAKSAQVKPGQNLIRGSVGTFEISMPVIQRGGQVLMAMPDVAPFFQKAFRLSLKQESSANMPSSPDRPGNSAASVMDETVPLEHVAPDKSQSKVSPESPAPPESLPGDLTPIDVPAPKTEPPPTPEVPVQELTPIQPEPPTPAAAPANDGRALPKRIDTVIIDPGHGGGDSGAVGTAGLTESALDLAVALRLQKALENENGLKVFLTRDKDEPVSRRERVSLANSQKGDLFVSLHAGASLAPDAHGFEIFCPRFEPPPENAAEPPPPMTANAANEYAPQSAEFAEKLAEAFEGATQAVNRGIHALPCQVLKDVAMPGLLIEMGCISNASEEALLQSDAYQEKIAQGIAGWIKGIRAGSGGANP